ncbi:MAG: PAS domain-containing protein [Sneathiella sp.]
MNKLSSNKNHKLLRYWEALPKADKIPQRANVDPIDMDPEILPHIFLCSLFHNPFTVRFRLQGTYINGLLGQNYKGKELNEETFGSSAEAIKDLYKHVAEGQGAHAVHESIKSSTGVEILAEVLYLPLLGETGNIEFILGSIDALNLNQIDMVDFVSKYWKIEDSIDL